MRLPAVALTAALTITLALSPADAGKRVTAAGITIEPPAGWKLASQPDGGASLTNPEGDIVWRFFATEPAADLHAWFDEAWRVLAAAHVKVEAAPAQDSRTKTGFVGRAVVGVMTDAKGGGHVLLLGAVSDGKRVAPMLIEFASQDSVGRSGEALTAASDSIKLGTGTSSPKVAFAKGGWRYPLGAAVPATADAKELPFLGKWAASQSAYNAGGTVSYGSHVYQYDFHADGTYTYHSEAWGGTFNANWRYIVDEKGGWTASGDQLTVAPTSVTGVVRDLAGKIQKQGGPSLEKVTYRFQTTYFSGLKETQLVLTPPQQTSRDGSFASNDSFPKSYLLSNKYQPEFKFSPN